ncbi:MAG TPA: hypothetical protein VHQ00_15530, partial [Chloroflexota bacterium]|nr:hypothetical protein [Chloroflexota bacterium]
ALRDEAALTREAERSAQGQVSGRFSYVEASRGIVLSRGDVTSLAVSGETATYAGTGVCLDLRQGGAAGALRDEAALTREAERSGRSCSFTARATDGGAFGREDAVFVQIDGLGTVGGPVRSGDVRIATGR